MTDKQIMIDGLSCDNCPDAQRCQEQQAKKEYAINQVLQDIPSEYANVISRLKQIIPSITRCDYVLEKQLKRKEQRIVELNKTIKAKEQECEQKDKDVKFLIRCLDNSFKTRQDSELYWERENKKLKAENEHLLEKEEEARHYLEEAAKFKNCLAEIKEIAEKEVKRAPDGETFSRPEIKQILQKISECEV